MKFLAVSSLLHYIQKYFKNTLFSYKSLRFNHLKITNLPLDVFCYPDKKLIECSTLKFQKIYIFVVCVKMFIYQVWIHLITLSLTIIYSWAFTSIKLKFGPYKAVIEHDDPVSIQRFIICCFISFVRSTICLTIDPQLVRVASEGLQMLSFTFQPTLMLCVPVCWDCSVDSRAVFVSMCQNSPSLRVRLLKAFY